MKATTRIRTTRRIAVLAILTVLAMALAIMAGCSGTPTTTAPTQTTAGTTAAAKGYTFTFKGSVIAVAAPAAPILESLGDPINYFEAPSCAFQGLDKIYTYAGMEFQAYTENEVDYIYSISVLDDTVETPEGIALGASADDVKAAYGTGFTESTNQLLYTKDNCQLKFVFEDNELVSVEYTLITAG
jgi:hypothetical protein